MRYFSLILSLALFSVACIRPQATTGQDQPTGTGTGDQADPVDRPTQAPPSKIGETNEFPHVFQGAGRSIIYEAWTMRFTLEHEEPLIPVTNGQIPWVDPTGYDENIGNYITYVLNGRQISLNSPYIQVQYFNKALPDCGTVDSVFAKWDGYFLAIPGSKLADTPGTLTTKSRLIAHTKSYQLPDFQDKSGKFIRYAFIDFDKDYIIGFAFTSLDESDFRQFSPYFNRLVQSFSLYGG